MSEIRDLAASLRAEEDQFERDLGERLGLKRGIPRDAIFLVSPDVGMRLTREGVTPPNVRISWWLPPKTAYAMDPSVEAPTLFPRERFF